MKYNITIDSNLYNTYTPIHLACFRFQVAVQESDPLFWEYMDTEVLPDVVQKIEEKEWSQIPGVQGSRKAYKAFGRNPGRYRVSSEALLRRVKRNDDLYRINSVVDVNNLLSLKSGLSVGSYDLSKIQGDIVFRKALSGESYSGIGKSFIDMENMLVLADEQGIFGSSMSDSTRAMVQREATDILVIMYCFEDMDLHTLLQEGKEAFVKFANAQNIEAWIL